MSAGNPPDDELPPDAGDLEDKPPSRWQYYVVIEIVFPNGVVCQTIDMVIESPVQLSDSEVTAQVADRIGPIIAALCSSPGLVQRMGGRPTWRIVAIVETFE